MSLRASSVVQNCNVCKKPLSAEENVSFLERPYHLKCHETYMNTQKSSQAESAQKPLSEKNVTVQDEGDSKLFWCMSIFCTLIGTIGGIFSMIWLHNK